MYNISIFEWTSAFITYASIYLEQFPGRHQEMLKYLHTIRMASHRGYGWQVYDKQFRLRVSRSPQLSWGTINPDLWLMYITGKPDNFPKAVIPGAGFSRPSASVKQRGKSGYCWDYNEAGKSCTRKHCTYPHVCYTRSGGHPIWKCTGSGFTGAFQPFPRVKPDLSNTNKKQLNSSSYCNIIPIQRTLLS